MIIVVIVGIIGAIMILGLGLAAAQASDRGAHAGGSRDDDDAGPAASDRGRQPGRHECRAKHALKDDQAVSYIAWRRAIQAPLSTGPGGFSALARPLWEPRAPRWISAPAVSR